MKWEDLGLNLPLSRETHLIADLDSVFLLAELILQSFWVDKRRCWKAGRRLSVYSIQS